MFHVNFYLCNAVQLPDISPHIQDPDGYLISIRPIGYPVTDLVPRVGVHQGCSLGARHP